MRILAFVLVCAAAVAAQEKSETVTRTYDVAIFGGDPEVAPPPLMGLLPQFDQRVGLEIVGVEGGLSPSDVADLISGAIEPGTWDSPPNGIEAQDGRLVVRHDAATQERVAAYLDLLSRSACRRVAIDAEVLLFEPGVLEASGVSAGPLTPEEDAVVRAAAADPKRAKLLGALRGVARSGGRAWAGDLKRRSHVGEYDVEIAQHAVVADPILGVLSEGSLLEVRPLLGPDGTVLVGLRFTGVLRGPDLVHEPAGEAEGRLRLPSRTALLAGGTCGCPAGRTVLFAGGAYEGAEGGRTVAVLVRASSATDPADSDLPWGDADLRLCILDTAAISEEMPNYWAEPLDLPDDRNRDEAGCGIMAPDERGLGIDEERLSELVQRRTGSDPWSVDDARLEPHRGRLVLAAAPGTLEAARQVLASAFPRRERQMGVDAVVVAASPEEWEKAREGDLAAFVAAAARGQRGRLAASARALGLNGQRFHAFAGRETAFVRTRDAEVAEGASGLDPVLAALREGLLLDVRPTLAADGRIHVEMRCQFATNGKLEAMPSKRGGLHRASVDTLSSRGEDWIEAGRWVVAAEGERATAGGRESLALLYRVRVLGVK